MGIVIEEYYSKEVWELGTEGEKGRSGTFQPS